MDVSSRPLRSMLYVPASNTRALDKLESLTGSMKPDAVMFDLEDGVAPNRKDEARIKLHQFLKDRKSTSSNDYFSLVRINRVDTSYFEDDAAEAYQMVMNKELNVNGVVLPKIEGQRDVDLVSQHFLSLSQDHTKEEAQQSTLQVTSPIPLWAMIETPKAILSVSDIASQPSIQGLILGTNDLSKELRLRPAYNREGLSTSLQLTLLAGRAWDKPVIDGVYNNIHDEEGFRHVCLQAKEMGMDGKTLIHPNQISATNDILAPSPEEIKYARSVVACWNEAEEKGVAVLNGMMIEQLHVDAAKRLLEQAERIESMV